MHVVGARPEAAILHHHRLIRTVAAGSLPSALRRAGGSMASAVRTMASNNNNVTGRKTLNQTHLERDDPSPLARR